MSSPALLRLTAAAVLLSGLTPTATAEPQNGSSSRRSDNGLVLPDRPKPKNDERRDEAPAQSPGAEVPTLESGSPAVLAAKYLGVLAETKSYDEQSSRLIAAQLLALGEDGLRAARAGLELDDLPTLVTSVRVMLSEGTALDQERLDVRLSRNLPKSAAVPILRAMAGSLRPDRVQRLVRLLDHPQGTVRAAAERTLRDLGEVDLLPELQLALASKRSDARRSALMLVRDDLRPEVEDLLIGRLSDRSPQVAAVAADLLGERPSEMLSTRLEELAFSTSILDRNQCYALLALVRREDRQNTVLIGDERREQLLMNMRGRDPLARGLSAAALAGLGFRSAPNATDGCRDEVPETLVAAVAGSVFHEDMTSLFDVARDRLVLLSGVDYGEDGPAWRSWWRDVRGEFQPRRAVISVPAGARETLSIVVLDGKRRYALLGPAAVPRADLGEQRFSLSADESAELYAAVEVAGLFGLERASRSALTDRAEVQLDLRVAGQAKRFASLGAAPGWMREVIDVAERLRAANRWQSAFEPGAHGTREAFVATEAPFWRATGESAPTTLERTERLKELLLGSLSTARGAGRDGILAELEELVLESPLAPEEAEVLVGALDRELSAGSRVERLVALSLSGIAAVGPEAGRDELGRSAYHRLYLKLSALFGESAKTSLLKVVDAAGIELARELVFEDSGFSREVAAQRLAKSPEPEDRALLAKLLEDSDPDVQVAAITAVGVENRRLFQPAVAARAELGQPVVRMAALESLGRLGGQNALPLLIDGLSTGDDQITAAAARGLALLGDPDSATVLASLLSTDVQSETFQAARRGLIDLGDRAWPQLLAIARDPQAPMRREAALILARQGVSSSLPLLIEMGELRPDDLELGYEMAVLTGVDLRAEINSTEAWWAFWDRSRQDDSLAWFAEAQMGGGYSALPVGGLEGPGTREAALNLWRTVASPDDLLAERARRLLSDVLDTDLGRLPARGTPREDWREEIRSRIDERWPL